MVALIVGFSLALVFFGGIAFQSGHFLASLLISGFGAVWMGILFSALSSHYKNGGDL